jgi:hypothetical protein
MPFPPERNLSMPRTYETDALRPAIDAIARKCNSASCQPIQSRYSDRAFLKLRNLVIGQICADVKDVDTL